MPTTSEAARVTPDRHIDVVADGEDGLVFPSDVLFGVTPRQRSDLFVCNFANDSPDDGAILRAHPFAEGDEGGSGNESENGSGSESNGDEAGTENESESDGDEADKE